MVLSEMLEITAHFLWILYSQYKVFQKLTLAKTLVDVHYEISLQ